MPIRRALATLLLAALALPAGAARPRDAGEGLYPLDPLRQAIRSAETAQDRALELYERQVLVMSAAGQVKVSVLRGMRDLDAQLDGLRADYVTLTPGQIGERLDEVEFLAAWLEGFEGEGDVKASLKEAWLQFGAELTALRTTQQAAAAGALGWSLPPTDEAATLLAVAECNELARSLRQRLVQRARDSRQPTSTAETELRDEVLSFELAVDQLVLEYRRSKGPGDLDRALEEMIRTSRLIEAVLPRVRDEESTQEWNELRESYWRLMEANDRVREAGR